MRELMRYLRRGSGQVLLMAWTLEVMLSMVRSFILWVVAEMSSVSGVLVSFGETDASFDAMVRVLVEA